LQATLNRNKYQYQEKEREQKVESMNIYFMLTDIFASFYCHEDAHIIGTAELVSLSRERNRSSETRTTLAYIQN